MSPVLHVGIPVMEIRDTVINFAVSSDLFFSSRTKYIKSQNFSLVYDVLVKRGPGLKGNFSSTEAVKHSYLSSKMRSFVFLLETA